eukprot:gene20348-28812_t
MKLLILDRDGTLNRSRDDYVASPDEWEALPGALEAVARLNQGGWRIVLATNQSGIGRGLFDMSTLNAIHLKMNQALAAHGGRFDAVFFSSIRPGRGLRQGQRYGVALKSTPMVGDTLRDLQAGAAAGGPTHLVRTGKSAHLDGRGLATILDAVPGTHAHADLAAFAEWLIRQERQQRGDSS